MSASKKPLPDSEFKLKTKKDLVGTNYMEFHYGDFEGSPVYWNDSSVYINHDVYKIMHSKFKLIGPTYNDYNINPLNPQQQVELITILKSFLADVTGGTKRFADKYGENGQKGLETLILETVNHLESNIHSNKTLWIMGI